MLDGNPLNSKKTITGNFATEMANANLVKEFASVAIPA